MKHWWDTSDLRREEERRLNEYLDSLDEDEGEEQLENDVKLDFLIDNHILF
jgi:hypothetical protein